MMMQQGYIHVLVLCHFLVADISGAELIVKGKVFHLKKPDFYTDKLLQFFK